MELRVFVVQMENKEPQKETTTKHKGGLCKGETIVSDGRGLK